MEFVFHASGLRKHGGADGRQTLHLLVREAIWSGLIALALAIPLAAWVASRISARLDSVVAFARRIAEGDLDARFDRAR